MEDAILMEDSYSEGDEGNFGNGYTWERTIIPLEISEEMNIQMRIFPLTYTMLK